MDAIGLVATQAGLAGRRDRLIRRALQRGAGLGRLFRIAAAWRSDMDRYFYSNL